MIYLGQFVSPPPPFSLSIPLRIRNLFANYQRFRHEPPLPINAMRYSRKYFRTSTVENFDVPCKNKKKQISSTVQRVLDFWSICFSSLSPIYIYIFFFFMKIRTLQRLDMSEFRSFGIVKFLVSWNKERYVSHRSLTMDYFARTYILFTAVFQRKEFLRDQRVHLFFPRDIAL